MLDGQVSLGAQGIGHHGAMTVAEIRFKTDQGAAAGLDLLG
jgi:hypothetical protein